jgi:hypothetical protein
MESQLRDLLDAAVGDPPRRVTVEGVRRRVARRRKLECVTCAAVAVVLLALGTAVSAGDSSRNSAAGAGREADVPRYYVTEGYKPVVVRSTATGTVTATVPTPKWTTGGCPIAAADHQTFFMACAAKHYALTNYATLRIYRFRVTATGQVTDYSVIPGGAVHGRFWPTSFAASADGSEVAVGLTSLTSTFGQKIVVINTATGSRAFWRSRPVPGRVFLDLVPANLDEMSFTGDGGELVLIGDPQCDRRKSGPSCHITSGDEVIALSPADGGGDVASGRVLLRQSSVMRPSGGSIQSAVISPDGRMMTLLVQRNAAGRRPATESVVQYSTATGAKLRVIYQRRGILASYQYLGSDPSGRYFLLDTGDARGVNGWIDHGRLARLPPAADNLSYEAW